MIEFVVVGPASVMGGESFVVSSDDKGGSSFAGFDKVVSREGSVDRNGTLSFWPEPLGVSNGNVNWRASRSV
jgi:hypothetical protein